MKYDEYSRNGTTLKKTSIPLEDIFSPSKDSKLIPRRIILQGEAGSGKTTICVKLLNEWANNESKLGANRFKLALQVRLRTLRGQTLEQTVVNLCIMHLSQGYTKEDVEKILYNLDADLLLVLDGLDETAEDSLDSIRRVLEFNKNVNQSFLRGATILVTTRPNPELDFFILFDKTVKISQPSIEDQDKFINAYVTDAGQIEKLKLVIRETFNFTKNKLSPLMLTILCYLHEEHLISSFKTEYELVGEMIRILASICVKRENLPFTETGAWTVLSNLGKLYFESDSSNYFPERILNFMFNEQERILIKQSGLLVRPPSFQNVEEFEPVHKVFLEYLTVCHLQYKWDSCSTTQERRYLLSTLLSPILKKNSRLDAFDFEDSDYMVFTCPVVTDSISLHLTGRRSQLPTRTDGIGIKYDCKFLMTSQAVILKQRILEREAYVKVKCILLLRKFSSTSKAVPKQFHGGLKYIFPLNQAFAKVARFTYHINRDCNSGICPETLAMKDLTVKEMVHFEYRENFRICKGSYKNHHKSGEVLNMLSRALANSLSVICTTQSFLSKKLLRPVPGSDLQTLETNGDFNVLQSTLREITKFYLKCSSRFHFCPEEGVDANDFMTRLYNSIKTSMVNKELVMSWEYHGHIYNCILEYPRSKQVKASLKNISSGQRRHSQGVHIDKMVRDLGNSAYANSFVNERFCVKLSVKHNGITLNIKQCDQDQNRGMTDLSISWQVMKYK